MRERIVGLTVLKNATDMGYPWVESLLAVEPICDYIHIAEGYSHDDTWDVIQRLKRKFPGKISTSRFHWPKMDTGFSIGAATNDALLYVRNLGGKILYVQADELWHHDNLPELQKLAAEDYDAYSFPYLHLEHNCQEIQQGAGYHFAVRMVANRDEIIAHRDAWTFEGYQKQLQVMSLPHPIVHCNYCFWDNKVVKKEVQAVEFYEDLGNYKVAAERARQEYESNPEPPAEYLNTESPFAAHLPPIFLPMVGQRKYYVREELLK